MNLTKFLFPLLMLGAVSLHAMQQEPQPKIARDRWLLAPNDVWREILSYVATDEDPKNAARYLTQALRICKRIRRLDDNESVSKELLFRSNLRGRKFLSLQEMQFCLGTACARERIAQGLNQKPNYFDFLFLNACTYNSEFLIKRFLSDPHVNVNLDEFDKTTPLMLAVTFRHRNIVNLLLNNPRVNLTAVNNQGGTPLIFAGIPIGDDVPADPELAALIQNEINRRNNQPN